SVPADKSVTFLFLTPLPHAAPHSSLVYMFGAVRREFGNGRSCFTGRMNSDGSWDLDLKAALDFLRQSIAMNDPVVILGTAFNFVHLLDFLADSKITLQLASGSGILETGGYKGRSRVMPKEELHSLIGRRLCVRLSRIVCEYGMSELSSQA